MRLLAPGGILFTASCSFHVGKALFSRDAGGRCLGFSRRLVLREVVGQPSDHPEI